MIRFPHHFAAIAALSFAAAASAAPAGLESAVQQARSEGKLLIVALCAGPAQACAAYHQQVRQAMNSVLFRDWAVVVAPDLASDAYAVEFARRQRFHGEPEVGVYGADGKKIWAAYGAAEASRIATSLDRGVCAAAVHGAPQIPAAFGQRHGAACRVKAEGVSWSAEPEILRP